MDISDDLKLRIEETIRARLGADIARSVTIESIEVSSENSEIRLKLLIESDATSDELADRFFGLTRRVKRTLGDDWRDFFPVITPVIGQEAHA